MTENTEIERVREIRALENLSYTEFADKIGEPRSTVHSWLNRGKSIDLKYLYKIADAFPHYRREWIIKGKGAQKEGDVQRVDIVQEKEVPKYNIDIIYLSREEFSRMLSIQESQQRTIENQQNLIDRLTKNTIAGGA